MGSVCTDPHVSLEDFPVGANIISWPIVPPYYITVNTRFRFRLRLDKAALGKLAFIVMMLMALLIALRPTRVPPSSRMASIRSIASSGVAGYREDTSRIGLPHRLIALITVSVNEADDLKVLPGTTVLRENPRERGAPLCEEAVLGSPHGARV